MADFCEIELTDGRKMKMELFAEEAPKTVANFLSLASEGFFDGLIFHRVIPNFMIQGGGYTLENGEMKQKFAKPISGEFWSNQVNNSLKHEVGTVSMARTNDKNSASSQFFICVAPCEYLDGQYAAFGKLVDEESIAVAKEISEAKTGRFMAHDDFPVQSIVIKTIRVLEG
jgi:peptidyl-prolyl cis-trans isomerase B (cyclophilin B)